jgi:uncharacterized protein (DUF885 family)
VREAQAFLKRLDAIPAAQLAAADRVNHAILRRGLAETVEAERFPSATCSSPPIMAGTRALPAWRTTCRSAPAPIMKATSPASSNIRKLNDQALAITGEAVRGGHVLPCSVLGNYERSISGVIAEDPAKSRFYEPFTRPRPADVSEAEWAAMQQRARRIITDVLNPAYAKHLDFYRTELRAALRQDRQRLGAAGRPRILRLPGAAGDDHRPDARADPRDRPQARCAASAPRWTRSRRRRASPQPRRPSSRTCAPTRAISPRRPRS